MSGEFWWMPTNTSETRRLVVTNLLPSRILGAAFRRDEFHSACDYVSAVVSWWSHSLQEHVPDVLAGTASPDLPWTGDRSD